MTSFKNLRTGRKKPGRTVKVVEKSRKEMRKEQRKLKKRAKAAYFLKKKESRKDRKYSSELENNCVDTKSEENKSGNVERTESEKKCKEAKKRRDFEREKEKRRRKWLREANEEEDRVIKKLEKCLKLNKTQKRKRTEANAIPKSFVADGLDYLLEFCVEENRKRITETEACLVGNESDTEFKKDLSTVLNEETGETGETGETEEDTSAHSDLSIDETEVENRSVRFLFKTERSRRKSSEEDRISLKQEKGKTGRGITEDEMSEDKGEDKDGDIFDDDNEEDTDTENHLESKTDRGDSFWEDIYGRKRDKRGNVVRESNGYVPPGVRTREAKTEDEKLFGLRRQLKGCLNRLAEHNMHSIANQIDELYAMNSRNNTNDTLSKLMLEALVSPVLTPDRLISEHMMLIAILHANVGVEVGAHFLLTFVNKCDEMLNQPQDVENKELDNLILMISHLYNFKVYGHKLLYEILDKLAEKFTEKEIELILLVLRTVGFRLRKDDPIALKEFIQRIQERAGREKVESSRVRFMLDVLLAIKNNNVSKIPRYDPSHVEHLKKVVKSVIRKGNAITQFNVSLDDLLRAEEKGKWWVVGSAWSGCDFGSGDANNRAKSKEEQKYVFGEKILELARKQRMNTDIRRNIFCVIMTADDYLDAFEKLLRLGLKDRQEREVIRVLMHCCLQENKFNPYYAVLAQKFCDYDRKYQLTIQYALWDKLKTLQEFTDKQSHNLARFLTHLFLEKSLAFSVLKIIQFAELDKPTMKLLRQILLGVLVHENEEACLHVFERISVSPQLQSFRESLRLFVNHFLIKNLSSSSILDEKEAAKLKARAESVDKILATRGSGVTF